MILPETEQLVLRPWFDDDGEAVYKLLKDVHILPVFGREVLKEKSEGTVFLKELQQEDSFALVQKATAKVIGGASLKSENGEGEIVLWIGFPYWRKGCGKEALQALLNYGFAEEGLQKITASCATDNKAALRLLKGQMQQVREEDGAVFFERNK